MPAGREAGFSVLELMVVVGLLALVTVGALRLARPVPPGVLARAAALETAALLRQARGEAIATNRAVGMLVDIAGRRVVIEGRPAVELPAEARLTLVTARDEVVTGSLGRIRFDGDGSSSGGRIGVTVGDGTVWVGVDWLSGRVSLAASP